MLTILFIRSKNLHVISDMKQIRAFYYETRDAGEHHVNKTFLVLFLLLGNLHKIKQIRNIIDIKT